MKNNLKNIISIRDILITRTFISTFQNTIADDLVVDTTYNIMNPIFDSGNLLLNSHSNELKILITDVESLKFWLPMALFLWSIYYVNNDYLFDDSKSLERLNKFIPYEKVRRITHFIITIIGFVFMKNILPVT